MMTLRSLFENLPVAGAESLTVDSEIVVSGLTTDPDLCEPGFLYIADISETVDSKRYGRRLDGRNFIERALNCGAIAVLTTPDVVLSESGENSTLLITYPRPLELLGFLCARFYGQAPSQIALVTGTNGKTSIVNFAARLWALAGYQSCSIGNLGGNCSDGRVVWGRDPVLSVPETVTLHKILQDLQLTGVNHLAMETTSHALHDFRLNGVPATIGAFTNLTRDHLDFHKSMDEYFRVKMTLFNNVLAPGSWAVLNADSEWYEQALAICRDRDHNVISYGFNGENIRLVDSVTEVDQNHSGQKLIIEVYGKKYNCFLNLLGLFQVSNVLCALAIVIASGVQAELAVSLIEKLEPVEGRLNKVAVTPSGASVIVDYAHSPDSIRAALEACRTFTEGKLFIIFGCSGEGDTGKRVEMGAMAAQFADVIIVSDDQPHHEDPAAIRQQILVGAPGAREIAGREAAIEAVLPQLQRGDTLLLAGLGHENFQAIGDVMVPYSDSEVVKRLVTKLS